MSEATLQSVHCSDGKAVPYPVHENQNELCCIQIGMQCQRRHHNEYVVLLEKLYHIYVVGYDERMCYRVECNEAYVSEVCDLELKPAVRS